MNSIYSKRKKDHRPHPPPGFWEILGKINCMPNGSVSSGFPGKILGGRILFFKGVFGPPKKGPPPDRKTQEHPIRGFGFGGDTKERVYRNLFPKTPGPLTSLLKERREGGVRTGGPQPQKKNWAQKTFPDPPKGFGFLL